jgi:hypothetical protein
MAKRQAPVPGRGCITVGIWYNRTFGLYDGCRKPLRETTSGFWARQPQKRSVILDFVKSGQKPGKGLKTEVLALRRFLMT